MDSSVRYYHVHVCPAHRCQIGRADDRGWLCRYGHHVALPDTVDVVAAKDAGVARAPWERSKHEVTVENRFDVRYMRPLEELSADDLIRMGRRLYERALKEKATGANRGQDDG